MDREQLKTSLDRLKPSQKQRQRMLSKIQSEAPAKKRFPYLRLGLAMAAVFAAVFLFAEVLPLRGNDMLASAPAEAPAADLAVTESVGMSASEQRVQGADYAFLLEHTPWRPEQTPLSLPVFSLQTASQEAGVKAEQEQFSGDGYTYRVPQADSYEERIVAFLVHYSLQYADGTVVQQHATALRTVQLKSYEQALQELLEGNNSHHRVITSSEVESGQLLYVEQGEELVPVYRFKIQDALIDVQAIK